MVWIINRYPLLIATFLGMMWTIPIGVMIGLQPKLARFAQPIVQILSSFPANMAFPFLTILYLKFGINMEFGAIPLMMLGTQWYILFNVIAGAMSIPSDLREAAKILRLTRWKTWKTLILPGIFPFLVTLSGIGLYTRTDMSNKIILKLILTEACVICLILLQRYKKRRNKGLTFSGL